MVLLHGSKLISLSNLCLSRQHYQIVTFIVVLLLWYPVTSGMWCTHHKAQERMCLSSNYAFLTDQLHLLPSSVFATFTFKLKFSEDCTLFKMQFYHKVTQIWWQRSLWKYFVSHVLPLTPCQGQHPELDRPFVSSNTASPISCALSNSLFLPPPHRILLLKNSNAKSYPRKHNQLYNKSYGNTSLTNVLQINKSQGGKVS